MRRLVLAVLSLAVLALAREAEARPGGGHAFRSSRSSSSSSRSSYSRSRSSSSSSSSSSTYEPQSVPYYKLRTPGSRRDPALRTSWVVGSTADASCSGARCKVDEDGTAGEWPQLRANEPRVSASTTALGVVIPGAALLFLVAFARRKRGAWSTAGAHPPPARVSPRAELRAIAATDPDFSTIAFEEQVQALYVAAHSARGCGQLDRLAPYLRPSVRTQLASLGQVAVAQVIVGALRIVSVQRTVTADHVIVELDTSYCETKAGVVVPVYATERWAFWRAAGVRTKPPLTALALRCPSCGASLETIIGSTCGHCRQIVDDGRFGWVVHDIVFVARATDSPVTVGAHAPEVGTSAPTSIDPGRDAGIAALAQTHGFTLDGALDRTRRIFTEMNAAWSSLEWERARPWLGRPLFEMQRYWIEAYRALGLRNVTEGATITRMDVAAVTSDRWYDAITIRVFATGLDYTLRSADAAVVGGSRVQQRAYSEYWTLVRGRAGGGAGSSCPSCGAPIVIVASARCEYCRTTIEAGHFDWVLARIEQDEVYGSRSATTCTARSTA